MIRASAISDSDISRWNELLSTSQNASYRQTIEYEYTGILKDRCISSHIFTQDNEDVAGAHYSIHKASRFPIILADIYNGIIFNGKPSERVFRYVLEHFIRWAKQQRASYLRYHPWLAQNVGGQLSSEAMWIPQVLGEYGFFALVPGRHTYWINLAQSESAMMAAMKKQTRYDVRSALKANLRTIEHTKFSNGVFQDFWGLYQSLGQQKKFEMLGERQMLAEIQPLMESGLAAMYFLYYDDVLVNASVASTIGQGTYLYGAINPAARDIQGCPPLGAAAQWTMIQAMRKKNLEVYDMGFCPGPEPIKEDPRYNIWRFKYGFGGDHVQFMPIYGKSLRPLSGRLFKWYRYGFDK